MQGKGIVNVPMYLECCLHSEELTKHLRRLLSRSGGDACEGGQKGSEGRSLDEILQVCYVTVLSTHTQTHIYTYNIYVQYMYMCIYIYIYYVTCSFECFASSIVRKIRQYLTTCGRSRTARRTKRRRKKRKTRKRRKQRKRKMIRRTSKSACSFNTGRQLRFSHQSFLTFAQAATSDATCCAGNSWKFNFAQP